MLLLIKKYILINIFINVNSLQTMLEDKSKSQLDQPKFRHNSTAVRLEYKPVYRRNCR